MIALANAEYLMDGIHPLLRVEINGRPALIEPARKPLLWDLGLVPVGDEFTELFPDDFPPVEVDPPGGPAPVTLEGMSSDRRLVLLHARFSKAAADGTLEPGPVPIPAAEDV